ncbi:hypothetical protein G9A89_007518 [Geosiphon pyriformis]|nr:hypothetical protein G9A89_007518 [Geosiphon pyriformis]
MENKEINRYHLDAHDCNKCDRCQRSILNNIYNYCIVCQFIFFKKHYKDFSSGNEEVDEIIKNPIYIPSNDEDNYHDRLNYYEWISWERLLNIKEIARGGFGIIYKATLIDGLIDSLSIKHYGSMEYERDRIGKEVAIKFIKTNGSEVIKELNIQRGMLIKGYLFNISSIYGITQNAETLEYGIVMEFANHGDLRIYLSTNFHSASWLDKLRIVHGIVNGLEEIHSSGTVHRNLHPGNILLVENLFGCKPRIGDLGLSQPTNPQTTTETTASTSNSETTTSSRTTAAATTTITTTTKTITTITTKTTTDEKRYMDFGMILWELVTGKPPFHDYSHDNILIMAILNGARPKITFPLIPPSIAEIIKKCWHPNPKNRPTAKEVEKKLEELEYIDEEFENENQFKESEKYVKEMLKNDSKTTTHIHPGAVYTSRPLILQMMDFSKG